MSHTKHKLVINMDGTCSAAFPEIGYIAEDGEFEEIGRMNTSHIFDDKSYDPTKIAVTYKEAPHCFKLMSDGEEVLANARRIVACWNACEGISTDNLEENMPVKWLASQYNAAVKQRDELLNIVKRLVNDGLSTTLVKDARSAIDKNA